jgi:hypothetical protein
MLTQFDKKFTQPGYKNKPLGGEKWHGYIAKGGEKLGMNKPTQFPSTALVPTCLKHVSHSSKTQF